MTMYTRREFGKITVAGLALPRLLGGLPDSKVAGVRIGVQTYSFRDLPRPPGGDAVDIVIKAITDDGLGECELWASQVEPQITVPGRGRGAPDTPEAEKARGDARETLRKWRIETPLDHFRAIGGKFSAAGITVHAYNYSFSDSMTDAEIDRGFEMAKALGAQIITASTTLPVAQRVVPFAEKHKMIVAMHGHSNVTDPKEFATPESFTAAKAMSKYYKTNLDIGHFTAANYDPVAYIKEQHQDITNLHLKDRKKNQGDNTPWGQGDTPINEVLQLLKKEKWPIAAYIEYEYRGTKSPVEEVKDCYEYCRKALA
jgi:sugar phosphate isomerase/epimerase